MYQIGPPGHAQAHGTSLQRLPILGLANYNVYHKTSYKLNSKSDQNWSQHVLIYTVSSPPVPVNSLFQRQRLDKLGLSRDPPRTRLSICSRNPVPREKEPANKSPNRVDGRPGQRIHNQKNSNTHYPPSTKPRCKDRGTRAHRRLQDFVSSLEFFCTAKRDGLSESTLTSE